MEVHNQETWNNEFQQASQNTLFETLKDRKKKEREEKFRALLKGSKPEENTAFARYRNGSVTFQSSGNFYSKDFYSKICLAQLSPEISKDFAAKVNIE